MKLYKFRSFDNLDHSLDILLNEQLHCAPYEKLNDPFEGLFLHVMQVNALNNLGLGMGINTFGLGTNTIKSPTSISDLPILGGTRICSLSASLNDVRLWSHYASGHSGIAIEIDFSNTDNKPYKVEYADKLKEFSCSLINAPDTKDILTFKSKHWEYEKEYRIITKDDFFSISGLITGIYLGLRTSELLKDMLLRIVPNEIPIYSTKLNNGTIDIELNKSLNRTLGADAPPAR